MHTKIEVYNELRKIADDIVTEVIAPACGIQPGMTNIWLADIETFVMEDDKQRETILTKIEERYQLKEHELDYVDSYTPLIQIALFIYLRDREGVPDGS